MPYPTLPDYWHEAVAEFFEHTGTIRRPTPNETMISPGAPKGRNRIGAITPVDTSAMNPIIGENPDPEPNDYPDGENPYEDFPISFRPVSTTRGEVALGRVTIGRSTADATAKANLKRARSGDILVVDEGLSNKVRYNILNVIVRQELEITTFRLERIVEKADELPEDA